MKVLVTNCSRNSGQVVMWALHRNGWEVQGADDRAPPLGVHSRAANAPYAVLPMEGAAGFAAALLELLKSARPDVLIPTRGIEAACQRQADVTALTACLLPPADAFTLCNDKALLLELCDRCGFPTPRRFELAEAARWLRAQPGREVVARPRRDVGGGQDVHLVYAASDLPGICEAIEARHGGVLVTEVIPGPASAMRAAHLLFDARSRLIASFVMQKTRIWPLRKGVTVAALSVRDGDLVESLRPLFEKLQWRGAADVEVKIDPGDGRPVMIEINPRFSGAIAFPIACGVDMAELYCRAALGQDLPEVRLSAYEPGRGYVDYSRWLAAVWAQRTQPGNLHDARAEFARRTPGVGRIDPGALLGKLLLSVPGLSRRCGQELPSP